MADKTQPDLRLPVQEGQQITPADWQDLQQNIDNAVGLLLEALGGPNFVPMATPYSSPLAVTTDGESLNIAVGGPGQRAIVQGINVDNCAAQVYTATPDGAQDRYDLIAVQSSRVPGASTIKRNIRADSNPTGLPFVVGSQLIDGIATVPFPSNFSSLPVAFVVPSSAGSTGTLTWTVTKTQIVVSSTDPNDNRSISIMVQGPEVGVNGTSTTLNYLVATATYAYVVGTPGAGVPPAPPAGFESFASVLVPANATALAPGNVTTLFPQLVAPVAEFLCNTLNVAQEFTALSNAAINGTLTVEGAATLSNLVANTILTGNLEADGASVLAALTVASLTATGDSTLDGALTVNGATTLQALQAATLVIAGGVNLANALTIANNVLTVTNEVTLSVQGAATLAALTAAATVLQTLQVTGATTLARLTAAASTLASLTVTGTAGIDGNLGVSGSTVLGALTAAATTLASLNVTGNATMNALAVASVAVTNQLTCGSLQVNGPAAVAGTLGVTGLLSALGGLAAVGVAAFAMAKIATNQQAPITVTVPNQLAAGTWTLLAMAFTDLGSGVSMTLTGNGDAWDAPPTVSDEVGYEWIMLGGTSSGNDQPSATLSFNKQISSANSGYLFILAIRVA